ncbi:MAG: DUF4124 domain-containing protein [Cellvibrionaceae bacterium]
MMKNFFIKFLFIFYCCYAFPVFGEIYRWVDETGNVHFSDTPKKGADEVKVKPHDAMTSAEDRKLMEANREWFEKRQMEREIAKQRESAEKARAYRSGKSSRKACGNAKIRLKKKQIELQNRKRAGIRVKTENWYRSKIEGLQYEVDQKC